MKCSSFVGGIVGIALSLGVFLIGFDLPSQSFSYTKTTKTPFELVQNVFPSELAGPGLPVRLKIPKINVDTTLEYVGLTPDGAMDVPKSRDDAAWFELGQRPGESGSAVIAGHYGWKNRKASVFDDLHVLRKGDRVYIEDDQGVSTPFVVREIRRYDPKADASDVFGSYDGKAHLNLVTCEGAWDERANQYPTRLVVFTDKETE